ncbi:RNA polymerase sigma factor [Paenibacillus sp. NPDC058177]|uniref:RNA polymerase sigma factor n=1 Tax=Paenibacillus sp. NPDC058177 TaxID=3346369 RepID=UPI0036DB91EC
MMTFNDQPAGMMPDAHMTTLLQAALKRYCLSLTQSPWDAEDLAQDTWIKVLSYLQKAEHRNIEALLLRTARNTWIDTVRRKMTFARILGLQPPAAEGMEDSCTAGTEAAFQALLEHLSPLQRTVFLLRDVLGHSALEAAELLNTTEGAVKAALHRARQSLPDVRKELADEGPRWREDSDYLLHLQRLAAAYEKGQVAELIRLSMLDTVWDTVVAVAVSSGQTITAGGYGATGWTGQPEMRMIA